ncbi:ser/Thr protein phosphatase family [Cordyceps fumosorosea ARSEF 2679]|uniref:Ser/Thr protein phosphatase family n=1 Tax=Cordyceps fumosorosea (strain ARSEF 2679) TaxID=1081104 RepID=A0A167LS52_CORFA|nr:ser/Thr protein phosphatase family [Cordyceps fumosorosea ARSEF 2679]OAA53434.1 ser/Thr protein phosphatase family [Cordyceps fumosorosea ARSEF 2679]
MKSTAILTGLVAACNGEEHSCYGPHDNVEYVRQGSSACNLVRPTRHRHARLARGPPQAGVFRQRPEVAAAGRYCETIGWVSMSGLRRQQRRLPRHQEPAPPSPFRYARRYLDWNRNTFIYHLRRQPATCDHRSGQRVRQEIAQVREELRLGGGVRACAPRSWCVDCAPFDGPENLFPGVIVPAVGRGRVVVRPERARARRASSWGKTGSVRYDIPKGPFTHDDNFIVSPFHDVFRYVKDVPYAKAGRLITQLDDGRADKRGELVEVVTPGYVTADDWGTDGDDTNHTAVPSMRHPGYYEARGGFPDGATPEVVDVVFYDFIEEYILYLGGGYNASMVDCYVDCNFTSQDFLLPYARAVWQDNINDCPVDGM